MKQLNKTENAVFVIGAVLMVVGSGANIFAQTWAPYIFAIGVAGFVAMQLRQRYEGSDVTLRRLRRMVIISDLLLVVSAVLMLANIDNMLGLDALTYIKYVHNNWVVTLLIAAMLQLYTSHRIASRSAD
ncbi:MAG: hypothetical protein SOZ58_03985 [Prevotella sp.]|nr:hypothetical protein [Prevotella sp.]